MEHLHAFMLRHRVLACVIAPCLGALFVVFLPIAGFVVTFKAIIDRIRLSKVTSAVTFGR